MTNKPGAGLTTLTLDSPAGTFHAATLVMELTSSARRMATTASPMRSCRPCSTGSTHRRPTEKWDNGLRTGKVLDAVLKRKRAMVDLSWDGAYAEQLVAELALANDLEPRIDALKATQPDPCWLLADDGQAEGAGSLVPE